MSRGELQGPLELPDRRWRKKPIVVEAVQWTGKNFLEIELFTALKTEFTETPNALGHTLYIFTREGRMSAAVGAWVIKGVEGEFYACEEKIFAQTYEPAAQTSAVEQQERAEEDALYLRSVTIPELEGKLQEMQLAEQNVWHVLHRAYAVLHEVVGQGLCFHGAPEPDAVFQEMHELANGDYMEECRIAQLTKLDVWVTAFHTETQAAWHGDRGQIPEGYVEAALPPVQP